jgi:tetracycline 7-halogenase / FADH2 O2-dependent halogenase
VIRPSYDIVILGSGVAGSSTALVTRRLGLSTLVIERDSHPRFAIGESTVPATTLGYDYLARTYKIPEFHWIAHYLGLKKIGCAAWPKQQFWFAQHYEGTPLRPNEELMLETLPLPLGPDVHFVRADVDGYLVSRFAAYGVDYVDHTKVVDFQGGAKEGVCLRVEMPDGPREVRARLVVDASGHASFLANRFHLRDPEPRLHTNTRTIFGHFRNVPSLETILGKPNPAFRLTRIGGTQHHCFRGGWVWVIPFDNGITSVGFVLDPRVHPDIGKPPEEEIRSLLERFPTIKAHLGKMEPVRKLTKTGRVQFTSKTILGDGFILTPHAAGFIDALFSTGLTFTQSFISRFAPLAKRALSKRQFTMDEFRPVDTAFRTEIETVDRLVSGTIRSFGHYDTFKQYWRIWSFGTIMQYFGLAVADHANAEGCTLIFGSAIATWRDAIRRMHETVFSQEHGDDLLAGRLKAIMDEFPNPHNHANYAIRSPQATNCGIIDPFYLFRWVRFYFMHLPEVKAHGSRLRLIAWASRLIARELSLIVRYRWSANQTFRAAVDAIRALVVPGMTGRIPVDLQPTFPPRRTSRAPEREGVA